MNSQELTKEVAAYLGDQYSQAELGRIFDAFVDQIENALLTDGEVNTKLGKFKAVERAGRAGRNPATGEVIQVPARTVIKLIPNKALRDSIAAYYHFSAGRSVDAGTTHNAK